MKISEIFRSIEGEGPRAGFLCTFIRTYGCLLRCSYCDTLYSLEGNDFKELDIDSIMKEVYRLGSKKITYTGGEPLIQPDSNELIWRLVDEGYEVNIETSGAVNYIQYLSDDNIIVTADWKCPSSSMNSRMIRDQIHYLRDQDVLKFVVGSQEDLDEMKTIIDETAAQIFVSPMFGKINLKDIVDYMQEYDLFDVRFQIQLHKIVWNFDERGV